MFLRILRLLRIAGRELIVLWYACRNPATPRLLKFASLLLALYVLVPVDAVTDFLPILGWLDDVTLLAFAVPALLKLVPDTALREARAASEGMLSSMKFWPR